MSRGAWPWIQALSLVCLVALMGARISAGIFFKRGDTHFRNGRYQEAVRDYDFAITMQPGLLQQIRYHVDYSFLYVQRGLSNIHLGLNQEAVQDFTRSIEIVPTNEAAYLNRGVANARLRQSEEAIADYSTAIDLLPIYACSYANRALENEELGRYREALDDLNEALKIRPNYVRAYIQRGFLHLEQARPKAALKDFNQAIDSQPESQHIDSISRFCYGRPNYGMAHLGAGYALLNLNSRQEAKAAITTAHQLAQQTDQQDLLETTKRLLETLR